MQGLLPFSGNELIQIGLIILAIVIAWIVLRTVLRLTFRIFTFGCGAILILGLAFIVLRWLSH